MVARITSGASPVGALRYNFCKIERGEAQLLDSNRTLLMPDEAFDLSRAVATFEPYLAANRRTRLPTFHVSLNPAPEDRLSEDELRDIARKYMERMGYGEQPYFVFRHTDIAREHLHVVSLRIDAQGRKLPHDFEARRSMEILRTLEREYGLRPVTKKTEQAPLGLEPLDYRASDIRRRIASAVRVLMERYRCTSVAEFRTLLSLYNISVEEQHGVIRGKAYKGIVFRALTAEGLHAGVPIRSSDIGRDVGYEALERYYARSAAAGERDRDVESLRERIAQVRNRASNLETFQRRLKQDGIALVVRSRKECGQDRCYDVTFIDHQRGLVVEGARIGRLFTPYSLGRLFEQRPPIRQHVDIRMPSLLDLWDTGTNEELPQLVRRRKRRKYRRRKS